MLNRKHIVLGITSSISAYKSCELARMFVKSGAEVRVVMSKNATKFVGPIVFETLTRNKVALELFPEKRDDPLEHISISDWADVFVVAPATANFIGKAATGIADDLISTVFLAMDVPVVIAPAMNSRMWKNKIVRENVEKLKKSGVIFVGPDSGELACGTTGEGRLADVESIFDAVKNLFDEKGILSGKKVLVTAGPTREYIDDVRFISNPSTGKMGFAIAEAALDAGAEVFLVHGPTDLEPPEGANAIPVISASEMAIAVKKRFPEMDIVVMTAAVSDWTIPKKNGKIKKSGKDKLVLELSPTEDILAELGKKKGKKILVGFAVETENLVENARKKIAAKNLDLIFANNPLEKGAGFATDTNKGVLITKTEKREIPIFSKEKIARIIIKKIAQLMKSQ